MAAQKYKTIVLFAFIELISCTNKSTGPAPGQSALPDSVLYNPFRHYQAVTFADRDKYFQQAGGELVTDISDDVDASRFIKAGWYPFGTTFGSDNFYSAQINWKKNRSEYAKIANLTPNNESCFTSNLFQCIRNISEYMVVTTDRNGTNNFRRYEVDVNGVMPDFPTKTTIFIRIPGDDFWMNEIKGVDINYTPSTGKISGIEIFPVFKNTAFDLAALSSKNDFERTDVYPMMKAINGGYFCDELTFYRFIHNDLLKNPEMTGNEFNQAGEYLTRTDATKYKTETFCDINFYYEYGSSETVSFDYYSGGHFENLKLTSSNLK